jgi:hypothetical protein
MPQRSRGRLSAACLLFFTASCAPQEPEANFVGRIELPHSGGLNGLSGLEVSGDGTSLLAVSDQGWFVTGRIDRAGGIPVAFSAEGPPVRMRNDHGQKVPQNQEDAEGIAIAPDGQIFVSYEVFHRVRTWVDITAKATWMTDLIDVARLGSNTGFEAVAYGPDNAVYLFPEDLTTEAGIPVYRLEMPAPIGTEAGRPIYRYRDARWTQPFSLPRRGAWFHPVGADFGPDGRLYLLERAFYPPIGFRSRIRRFDVGPEGVTHESVLLATPLGRHGNLEGLSVWRDGAGAIRLTMISDDNGLALQRNEIVEYRVASNAGDGYEDPSAPRGGPSLRNLVKTEPR